MTRSSRLRAGMRGLAAVGAVTLGLTLVGTTATAADETDPRVGLEPGYLDYSSASSNLELLANLPRGGAFDGPPGVGSFFNSDLAFTGDHAIMGSYNGFQVYDVSDPAAPRLEKAFVCPGGQGDVSVYGDLMFMSVEAANGRIDCGTQPITEASERFRGVRIFDISDIQNPMHLTGIQTCRGSHTHTVVEDPEDSENIYVYVSGTAGVRSSTELAGCTNAPSGNNPASFLDAEGNPILTSRFMVEVIKIPLDDPMSAEVVNEARLFTDEATGNQHGLWPGGSHGAGFQSTSTTDACHDITAYPEIGLAAGACEGNGILIDITDPADPKRIDAVIDPRFAYWHSATFNNDGTKVIFTDEWGGGAGARCRATDPLNWGANALFDIVDTPDGKRMEFASYYKMPASQTPQENCVAHNGSLVPVPGRDIMVQAWYQGGTSVFDFTDSMNPTEIAFFDRGPISGDVLLLGGLWSTYWYNGHIYGSEIGRGFDTFGLTPSDQLSANEIAAATEVQFDEFNAQAQPRVVHAPSFAVVRSYVDQAERAGTLTGGSLAQVRQHLDTAEKLLDKGKASKRAVQAQFDNAIRKAGDNTAVVDSTRALWESVR